VLIEDSYEYMIDGEWYRDYVRLYGIRLVMNVVGKGQTVSIPMIILHISTIIALAKIATIVCDFIMLNFPIL
jgi:hypothetical protein